MANNLGTVFVELSLDDSVYKQKLGETLTSTDATAKGIETSWKVLCTRSDTIFDTQRKSYENAMTLIKNSASVTADDIVRAEQAKNDKLNALNQQQFGSQTSFLDTLKSNWLAASAAIYGAMKLVGEGMALIKEGAKAMQAEEAFQNVASAYHVNADAMLADLQRLTHGTVDAATLMQGAMKGMSAGLSPAVIEQIAEIAPLAARRTGEDVSEAYKNIEDAIETMRGKALVAYGLLDKQEALWIQRLQSTGREYNMMPMVMANYTLELARIGKGEDLATEALQRHTATWTQWKDTVAKGMITVAGTLIEYWKNLSDAMDKALGVPHGFLGAAPRKQTGDGASGSWGAEGMTPEDAQITKAMEDARLKALAFKTQTDALAQSFDAWKTKIADLNPYLNQTEKEMATLTAEANKFIVGKPGIGGIPASQVNDQLAIAQQNMAAKQAVENQKIVADEMEKSQKKQEEYSKDYSALYKQVGGDRVTAEGDALAKITAAENEAKEKATVLWQSSVMDYETGQIKMAISTEQYQDLMTKATEKAVTERAKVTDQYETQRAQANVTLLSGIRGQEQTLYDFEMKSLDAKAQKYRDEGASELAIAAWLVDQEQIKNIARARGSDDMVAGMRAAEEQLYRDRLRYGEAGYQFIVGSYNSMNSTFASIFADGMKGQLKSLHDYWMTFWDSMADAFSKVLSKMLTDWIYSMFEMRQSSSSILGGGGGGFLGGLMGDLSSFLPGGFTSFGSLFSSLFPQSIASVAEFAPEIFMLHGGGTVGQSGTRRTDVSPAVFPGAPRLHSGLASDEFPTILQRGEKVIPRGKASGSGNNYYITVKGNLVDHDKFARELLPALQKASAQGVH